MRQKIHSLRSTNPKEYWKIINSGRKQISPNISINVLFDFFKTLNTGEPENVYIFSLKILSVQVGARYG
jgi:hypothetical protein